MSNLYLKLTLPIFLLLVVLMVVIHLQPHDDRDLRALLRPDDCSAPCFMGIRPGVTTAEQAVALLKANQWVGEVIADPSTVGLSAISWTWSNHRPSFIRAGSSGLLLSHTDEKLGDVVDRIRIEMSVPIGDIVLLMVGESTPIKSLRNTAGNQAVMQTTDDIESMRVWSVLNCPVTKRKFLDTPARIDFDRLTSFSGAGDSANSESYWCWRHLN